MSEPVTPTDTDPRDEDDDAAPAPIQPTGNARIDEALERLELLPDHEITSHPAEFEAIHRVLRESLSGAGRDEDE